MFPFDILIKEFQNEEQWNLKWSWNNVYRHSLFWRMAPEPFRKLMSHPTCKDLISGNSGKRIENRFIQVFVLDAHIEFN